MARPAINNGSSNSNGTGRFSGLRLRPEWLGILGTLISGVVGVSVAWATLKTQAEADREAWKARTEVLARDLEATRTSLRERLADQRGLQDAALEQLSQGMGKLGDKVDRLAEVLTRSTPELNGLKELPVRVRGLEQRLGLVEWRLDNTPPGQGIPKAPPK